MNLDYLDKVNDIQNEERKTKAIINSFWHTYIEPEKETAIREITINYEDFSYSAAVILDLVCDVMRLTDELELMISKETDQTA